MRVVKRNKLKVQQVKVKGTYDYNVQYIESLYSIVFSDTKLDNFFLSKAWIIQWLEQLDKKPELITFHEKDQLLGFVFIGYTDSFFGLKAYLNQSGLKQFDQVWIEYNDIICANGADICRNKLLDFLSTKRAIFQLHVSNTMHHDWKNKSWKNWSSEQVEAYETDLSVEDITQHFSKNTKRQINRSNTFIHKEIGELKVTWLTKQSFADEMDCFGNYHVEQWGEHEYGSGFNNKNFVDFHTNLLIDGLGEYVHLVKFEIGDATLGYLHFFTLYKRVYFYLSSINYLNDNNKFKPGLVMHKIAMQHFKTLGYKYYDFLAGDAQYKASLSSNNYCLYNHILYSNKNRNIPLKLITILKRQFKKRFSAR